MEETTFFASAERTSSEQILNEHELVASQKIFGEIFESITGIVAIINRNRQIIYANNDFLDMIGLKSLEPILGKRFGEIVSCVYSAENPGGCGTSVACAYCGAVNAILQSQENVSRSSRETRITAVIDGKFKSYDLNITSSPLTLNGHVFYALILQDISDEKRRVTLERIFFHDILNSAGGLNGLLTLLKEGTAPDSERELIELSEEASRDIIEEITLHRQIRSAENGDLQVKIETVKSIEILHSAIGKIKSHDVGRGKRIVIDNSSSDTDFETDRVLFQRVIINLLKNALEATPENGTVVACVEKNGDLIKFSIKNDSVIPEDVQIQLFQRSFSTKGKGRGIGTYSIKLLTENYLKGIVSFKSTETEKTTFFVELNRKFNPGL